MKHSETFTSIAAALAAAAGEFPPIKKNRTVEVMTKAKGDRPAGKYTFTYATLDEIVSSVRPALSKNGLVLVQSVFTEEVVADGKTYREDMLETRLIHASGEWFANVTPVMVDVEERSAQAYGSAQTYARRYGITALLCVVADEDDDGNAAAGNVARSRAGGSSGGGGAPVSDKQLGMLRSKLGRIGGNEEKLCEFLGHDGDLSSLPKTKMDAALAAIDARDPSILATDSDEPRSAAHEPAGTTRQRAAQDPAVIAARKARHDALVAKNSESLELIRYHLGVTALSQDDEDRLGLDLGERNVRRAVSEWREYSTAEQEDLWLAPNKGGFFTTQERDALRHAIANENARQRDEAMASAAAGEPHTDNQD